MTLRRSLAALWALTTLLLAACGGGGGGGSSELTIGAISPASIQLTITDEVNGLGTTVSLTAPFSGSARGTIYIFVVDPDLVFDSPSVSLFSDSATLQLRTRSGLAAGRYTQPLVIHACKNPSCSQEFAGSPQTVPKDITVTGVALGASRLNFSSTAALAPASQSVSVVAPAGLAFSHDALSYVDYVDPNGIASVRNQDEIFTITKTAGGLTVQPLAAWAGTYVLHTSVSAPGHQARPLDITYQVGPGVTPLITLLTPSVSGASTVGSRADVLVTLDVGTVVYSPTRALRITGSPDPGNTGWLLYGSDSASTPVAGLPADVTRYTFRLNTCGYGISCLAAGTYSATIALTASAFGVDTTVNVPVTFNVQ